MVDLMQELLPERIGPRLALEVHVGDDTRQIGIAQTRDVRGCRFLDLFPAGPQGRDVGEVRRVPQPMGRGFTPPFQPQPLGGRRMYERVPDRSTVFAFRRVRLVMESPCRLSSRGVGSWAVCA